MLLFFPASGTCSVSTASISPAHNMEDVPEGDTNKSDRSDCELCVRRRTIYDKEFFYSRENARSLPQPTCTSILNIMFFSIMSAQNFSFCQSFLQILCFLSPQIFDISWDLYQPNKLVSCGVKHIKVQHLLHVTCQVSRWLSEKRYFRPCKSCWLLALFPPAASTLSP